MGRESRHALLRFIQISSIYGPAELVEYRYIRMDIRDRYEILADFSTVCGCEGDFGLTIEGLILHTQVYYYFPGVQRQISPDIP